MDLFTLFLKLLDDGNIETKTVVARILEEDAKYEKAIHEKMEEQIKKNKEEEGEVAKLNSRREDWSNFNAVKLVDMGNTIASCMFRYREEKLMEPLVNAMERLCSITPILVTIIN